MPANDESWQRAIEMQCELIEKGSHRAASLPDLLIAATAERHNVTVLHDDGDYDLISETTNQVCTWVVRRGTAD